MSLLLLAAFLATLVGILLWGLRAGARSWSTCLVAAGLLLWADLVVAAQILSLIRRLNSMAGLVLLTLGGAILIALALRRWPAAPVEGGPVFAWTLPPLATRLLVVALMGTLSFVVLANLILAVGLLPSNPDSIVYRFPRIYWYLGHGSLLHFTNATEPRPLYYPFNGTLLFWPLVKFGLGPRTFTLPSLVAWVSVGFTTYAFARSLGGPRIAAAATAWLICLTPNVLIQAISTNDEVIAAWPLLAGLFFLHRWYRGGQKQDALIGFLGLALAAGTKLHVMFYWPMFLVIAAALALHWRASWAELRSWLTPVGGALVVLMIVIAAVFSFSFIAYNLASAGRATAWEFSAQILNKPFNLPAALQTTTLFLSQMVLTPVADLAMLPDVAQRAATYEGFNRLVAPLFGWVDNGPAFTSAFYRFTGINSPSAVMYNEQTVFIGFSWLVALIAAGWLWRRGRSGVLWGRLQLLAFPLWIVSFAFSTKYIEGFTVYLSYALIVSGPVLVFAFAPIGRPGLDRARWAVLGFVAASHFILACVGLYTTSGRNLVTLRRVAAWPASPGFALDPAVMAETRVARAGIVSYSIAWGQPYWPFMAYNPRIPQFMAQYPANPVVPADAPGDPASVALRFSRYVVTPRPDDRRLHVYTFPQIPAWGRALPVRIADRSGPGLTWIGDVNFALGPEWIFAAGNGVADRHPGKDKYIVQRFEELSNFGHATEAVISLSPVIYGLEHDDAFSFRYELRIDGRVVVQTEWDPLPKHEFKAPGLGPDNGTLTLFVRNDKTGAVYERTIKLRNTRAESLN